MEGFAAEESDRLGTGIGGVNFRLTRETSENFLVDLEDVLFVIEDENFLSGGHKEENEKKGKLSGRVFSRSHAKFFRCEKKDECWAVALGVLEKEGLHCANVYDFQKTFSVVD